MKKNEFKPFEENPEGINRKKVDTLAGHNYLEQAEKMYEEIRRINIANDRANANADRVKMADSER